MSRAAAATLPAGLAPVAGVAPLAGPAGLAGLAVEQAPVTQWPARIGWTLLTLAVLAGLYLLLRRGWRSRAARQGGVPPLPAAPDDLGGALAAAEGVYVSTTTEGDWLDRVVVHGLGVRAAASAAVHDAGVLLERDGAPEVWIPRAQLTGARLTAGMAGKFVEEGGLVVLTWAHAGHAFDTGFRPRFAEDRDRLLDAACSLLPAPPAEDPPGTPDSSPVQHVPPARDREAPGGTGRAPAPHDHPGGGAERPPPGDRGGAGTRDHPGGGGTP